jgi:PKD repeat protein
MNTFIFLSKQYKAETGVNMGEVISRPGSNPWVWCDVHSSENGLYVPLMCTVFFSNYNSEIYGKQNNKWILSDGKTGNEILNVKNTPYFIYTFTSTGYYTIYNQVEDAYGNVYEVSKPGFIEVIDHKDKRADDPDPFVVNSSDYGYPIPPKNEYQEIDLLSKELLKDQLEYIRQNATNFSSGLNIDNDPDATFNEIS